MASGLSHPKREERDSFHSGRFLLEIPSLRRVGLDYSEEVHPLVKNLNPRNGYLRQTTSMADKMENITKMPQVGVLKRPSFLFEGLSSPKKFDLQRTPLTKKCCHVSNHPCSKISIGKVLTIV